MSDNLAFNEKTVYGIHRTVVLLCIGGVVGFLMALAAGSYVFGFKWTFAGMILADELVCLALLANSYRITKRLEVYKTE